jgi:DNA topoisomerase I
LCGFAAVSVYQAGVSAADARKCPSCRTGRLGLKLSRNGGFIGCSGYPTCGYSRPLEVLAPGADDAPLGAVATGAHSLPWWIR